MIVCMGLIQLIEKRLKPSIHQKEIETLGLDKERPRYLQDFFYRSFTQGFIISCIPLNKVCYGLNDRDDRNDPDSICCVHNCRKRNMTTI